MESIEELLKIDLGLLADEYGAALGILAEAWERAGQPRDPEKLLPVLTRTLDLCTLAGVTYPRIFLKRKGELARRQFAPLAPAAGSIRIKAPSYPAIPQEWCDRATAEFARGLNEIRWKAPSHPAIPQAWCDAAFEKWKRGG